MRLFAIFTAFFVFALGTTSENAKLRKVNEVLLKAVKALSVGVTQEVQVGGSWQAYVDDSLIKSGKVRKAAIYGHDGTLWATSNGFLVSKSEVNKLYGGFSNPRSIQANGFYVARKKYIGTNYASDHIYGKSGSNGVVICKTQKSIIISFYDENITAGNAVTATEKLAYYLRERGY